MAAAFACCVTVSVFAWLAGSTRAEPKGLAWAGLLCVYVWVVVCVGGCVFSSDDGPVFSVFPFAW